MKNSTGRAVWDFVERCHTHTAPQALFDDFARMIAGFGFDSFIISGLPAYGENVENLVICNRWPVEWTERYRSQAYFAADPVGQAAYLNVTPSRWAKARAQSPATQRSLQIESEAAGFGLADGVSFPMFDPQNWQAVASLATDSNCSLSDDDISLAYLASLSCQMRATDLDNRTGQLSQRLTTREAEILTWIAAGKTHWDVSAILQIAEATVQTHLANARRKLDAINTTQAVARAARTRQIRI